MPCLILRSFEKEGYGIESKDKEILQEEQVVTIRFVDDNYLVENGKNVNDQMQQMLNQCNELRAAIEKKNKMLSLKT